MPIFPVPIEMEPAVLVGAAFVEHWAAENMPVTFMMI